MRYREMFESNTATDQNKKIRNTFSVCMSSTLYDANK